MSQPEIRIYTGKIKEWTKDILNGGKKAETICGRRLLAYGLLDTGRSDIFSDTCRADEVYDFLGKMMEKEAHGKPYFKEFPEIYFNISHSGEYASCALSSIPCGLDIQEIRPIRTKRLLEKTMTEEEQKNIKNARNPQWEFCRYWAMKESFLKLSGDGITKSMRDLKAPVWYEMFDLEGRIAGCISADKVCRVFKKEVSANAFFEYFKDES